jgi:hypothetical protein
VACDVGSRHLTIVECRPPEHIGDLLEQINLDPAAIFWG